jgi:hypothetical protein
MLCAALSCPPFLPVLSCPVLSYPALVIPFYVIFFSMLLLYRYLRRSALGFKPKFLIIFVHEKKIFCIFSMRKQIVDARFPENLYFQRKIIPLFQ